MWAYIIHDFVWLTGKTVIDYPKGSVCSEMRVMKLSSKQMTYWNDLMCKASNVLAMAIKGKPCSIDGILLGLIIIAVTTTILKMTDKSKEEKKQHCAIVLISGHFPAHSAPTTALRTGQTPYKSMRKWARFIFWLLYRPTEAVFPWHIIALRAPTLTGHKCFFVFFFKAKHISSHHSVISLLKLLLILWVTSRKKCCSRAYNQTAVCFMECWKFQ